MPKKKVVNTIKKEKEQPVQHYLPSIEPVKQSEPPKKKDSKPVIASNQETPQQTVPWTIRLLAWFSSFVFHLTGIAHTTAAIYFNYHKHPNVEYLARFLYVSALLLFPSLVQVLFGQMRLWLPTFRWHCSATLSHVALCFLSSEGVAAFMKLSYEWLLL